MKKPPPEPRHDRVDRQVATAHERLYHAMRAFLKDLERAEREYHAEVAAQREELGIDARYTETRDVERYSLAIQLFAGATIEAVVSLYAVLKFGGDKHDDHFRWGEADKRLKRAFHLAGIQVDDDAEILKLIRAVTAGRHPIAHPFAAEYFGPEQASIELPPRRWMDESAAAGRQAIAHVDRIMELLRELDEPESLTFTIF